MALAALVLVPVAIAAGALGGLRQRGRAVAIAALLQAAGPFLLIAAGEQEIDSGVAGILVATMPLFTVLLAMRVDHSERAERHQAVGLGVGLAGVALLLGVDLTGSLAELAGGLAVVLAALSYAVGALYMKRRLSDLPPLGTSAAVMLASTAWLAVPALIEPPSHGPGGEAVAAVAALGLLGTGLAFAVFYALIGRVGAARSSLVTYIAPGFAVVYGAAFLDEPITAAVIAGLGLILLGSRLAAAPSRAERPSPSP